MRLINSLKEVGLNEKNFPVFFWDQWLLSEKDSKRKVYFYENQSLGAVVPLEVYQLKFLKKANYIYKPLDLSGNELSIQLEKKFLDSFHEFLKKEKICDVIFPPPHFCNFKCIPERSIYFPLGIIRLKLDQEVAELFNKMKPNYRNEIKKAIKLETQVVFGNQFIEDFYELYKGTHQKQGINNQSMEYFQNQLKNLPENIQVGISRSKVENEAGIYNVFDLKNAYYFFAGTNRKATIPGANKLLLFESIKTFSQRGIKEFILGGFRYSAQRNSKHDGIQNFKLRFGGKVQDGYHFIKVLNPLRYGFFSFALKLKSLITGRDYSFFNKTGLEIKKS